MSNTQERSITESTSPLQTERGKTTIEDVVVAKIAGMAAQEVEGVHMGGGASRAIGGLVERATGSPSVTRGVHVEVGEQEAAIDLNLAVDYGIAIPAVAEAVRRNIINRVENLVGLKVTEVNITVNDVILPQPQQSEEEAETQRVR
ncbi:protein of unknown function DUF322 [Thermobaculum terrenum ATCC BAA-798]|uniref:Asp23 family protein n=1 Tax=Thermobaculum terrenum (strain ATCC BAA-798 / CCMEE 7001 / YNP1) TaxID=525904 RepID=D1CIE5_THET1|nr:Asp23/Gls24 family envelope stress response protein [Thermobaculum terrenum]ACZ43516.1 protein of unknown function DUF322 [Thermobaculum terrenum ATCC BAA-798]